MHQSHKSLVSKKKEKEGKKKEEEERGRRREGEGGGGGGTGGGTGGEVEKKIQIIHKPYHPRKPLQNVIYSFIHVMG